MKYVYTDGSCKRNGKTNPDAGIGIYFGDDDNRNVSRKIYGKQTILRNYQQSLRCLISLKTKLTKEKSTQ
jgi:ribonuclease HI